MASISTMEAKFSTVSAMVEMRFLLNRPQIISVHLAFRNSHLWNKEKSAMLSVPAWQSLLQFAVYTT